MKHPTVNHPIEISSFAGRVTVRVGDAILAECDAALVMREADYPPVYYLPSDEVDMSVLTPTDHQTYCPFKGEAGYFSISGLSSLRGAEIENAVWTYADPYPAMTEIAGHLAFYTSKVELEAVPAG